MLNRCLALILVLVGGILGMYRFPSRADSTYPVCAQPPLVEPTPGRPRFQVYLPLVVKGAAGDLTPTNLPACSVYCGLALAEDPYRPAGYRTYFADEFDCDQLLPYWNVQQQQTCASYTPPPGGRVLAGNGTLNVGVDGPSPSFPYLYLVDDTATTYEVGYKPGADWARRVDWIPDSPADFRVAMRVRFLAETIGEHRISIYADGHRPAWAGPLFYIGSDYGQEAAWRGLIAGADRGTDTADLGELGFPDPYKDWVVLAADFEYSRDLFTLSINGQPVIRKPLSQFKGYPESSTRPDTLHIGSLALLERPALWTNIELDWLRVYAPETLPPAVYGLLPAEVEPGPAPTDVPSAYTSFLPAGPFANTPHWSEEFDGATMPAYWNLALDHDPANAWTMFGDGAVTIDNNGHATGVPVWAIFDDMLPADILSVPPTTGPESPEDYLRRRGGSPFQPAGETGRLATWPRIDWRPDRGNVRFAWRALQTANGYGVEVSNGGHFPYFTGAIFYTLQDTTTNGSGQFIYPACQEQYFWRLHQLPAYQLPYEQWTIVTADYVNGTVHLYLDGQEIGWWPESDCSLNWYLLGENATSPDVLIFGNPATGPAGAWSRVSVDWFATFPGLPRIVLPQTKS